MSFLKEVVVTVRTDYNVSDAIRFMLSSMGLATDQADVAAAIMKLESAKGFQIASKAFGVLGPIQNVAQMIDDGDWNFRDTGQAALGAALLIPGLNGAIVIGGGAVLFGWELYELMQGH